MSNEPSSDPGALALRDRIAKRVGLPARGPTKVGRFVITGRLGVGGMGVVHRAFDPDLDRAVAIKLLGDRGELAQERLLREAQAMARLGHPNVVAIHEVGRHADAVYIAMELVEGGTLASWLRGGERTEAQILEMFTMAGRGLQAAHESGLVHRDFKPDNVLVGKDGRARVADFGLARASEDIFESVEGVDDELRDAKLARTLSRTGAVAGTPRYMAPEQFEGRKTDARTDQFSFCVALWEALCGEAPFPGDSVPKLAESVTRGRRREPPAGARLRTAVRRALERGLATRPDDRFENMAPLLDALRPRASRHAQVAGLGALVGIAGLAFAVAGKDDPATAPADPCATTADGLDAIWNARQRGAIERALRAVELPNADAAAERVVGRIETFASDWRTRRRDACVATRIDGSMSDEGFDLTVRCLDLALTELEVLVGRLPGADARLLDIAQAAPLPSLGRCGDLERLRRGQREPPAGAAADVAEGEAALARSAAYGGLGDYESALAQADAALRIAERIEFPPLRAQALRSRGGALVPMGRWEEGIEALSAAGLLAFEVGDDETAAHAEAYRMVTLARMGRPEEALRDVDRIRATLVRAQLDPYWHARAVHHVASTFATGGRLPEARAWYREAQQRYEDAGRPDSAIDVDCELGLTYAAVGEFEPARQMVQRCVEERRLRLGPTHPETLSAHLNFAIMTADAGEMAKARRLLQEFIDAKAARGVTEHPTLALAFGAIGNTHDEEGNSDLAVEPLRRALAIREATLGPDNPTVGFDCTNLANVLRKTGALEEAMTLHERALGLLEHEGPLPFRADARSGVARTLLALGRKNEACALAKEAIDIYETLGTPSKAEALQALANECER